MTAKFDLKDALKARIAWLAIGRSTLRNQGASGMVGTARRHLRRIDLRHFSVQTRGEFEAALNRETRRLMRSFPVPVQDNWGAARKSLNIFLRDVFYSHLLRASFRLSIIEPWLEMPLDSYSYLGLSKDIKLSEEWPGVKNLTPIVSATLQAAASEAASGLETFRVHLDIRYWQQRGL